MTEILTTLAGIPAIDPYRTKIAVDPGFYCLVPEETRNEAAAEIERLTAESEKLWNVLSWIDTFDPETTAAAEGKFGLDLQRRAFQQLTPEDKA